MQQLFRRICQGFWNSLNYRKVNYIKYARQTFKKTLVNSRKNMFEGNEESNNGKAVVKNNGISN